jgi:hypothetical protein
MLLGGGEQHVQVPGEGACVCVCVCVCVCRISKAGAKAACTACWLEPGQKPD